ncbi:MAG: hypothetical protein P1V20_04035 [Verrucomicrobiales bacterium]|nr:hypothetical protein [Verrucomicrobiales bacterium]
MEEPEIPWIYLAMVAIIFVRWLLAQLKKAARIREEHRRKVRRRWEGDITETVHEPPPTPHRPPAIPPPHPEKEPHIPQAETRPQPQTLQELFEQRRQEIAEAQRRAVTPPPVPKPKKKKEVVEPAPVQTTPMVKRPVPSPPMKTKPRRKSSLVKTLSNKNSIRNAIILKEILDKPKGLDQ